MNLYDIITQKDDEYMKKFYLWFVKAAIAGILAFIIISIFCFFYYNVPTHHTSKTNVTDYYWDKNSISIRGNEGFAFTKTDKNGYVNTYAKTKESTDVLIMGSSHTEGFNVSANENYAYLLNEKLYQNGHDIYAYNIGTSGHTITRCFRNLEDAINEFNPTKYITIETDNLSPSLEELKQLDEKTFNYLPSNDSGLIYHLQKSDFLRLVYTQLSHALDNNKKTDTAEPTKNKSIAIPNSTPSNNEDIIYLEKMLQNGSNLAKENGCQLVIVYIPAIEVDYEGKIIAPANTNEKLLFKNLCEKHDIKFIDMYSSFADTYTKTNRLPRGFSNTKVGVGHINKYGHGQIAKELYEFISKENNQ